VSAVAEAEALLKDRLSSLTDEGKRVEKALAALNGGTRRPGRPRGSTSTPGGAPKPRKRRSGTRSDQAVAFIEKHPGCSAADIAKAMKIKPNYLYRVLGELEKEGRVKKTGRKYNPVS